VSVRGRASKRARKRPAVRCSRRLFFGFCGNVAGRVASWSVAIRITELLQARMRGIRITRLRIRIRISVRRQASGIGCRDRASWQKTIKAPLMVLVAIAKAPGAAGRMKRIGNVWGRVCSLENIEIAHDKARKGKAHYREVQMVEADRSRYLMMIHDMLESMSYRNSAYQVMMVCDGKKDREIWKLPYFPDRIIHHAIVNVMEPVWIATLIRDSYAAIPGRGVHDGVRRVRRALENAEGSRYCLKMDVRKFYQSIDHQVLKEVLRQKIKDKSLLWLLDEIIDSAPGVPIGNYTSQYFGNLYLSGLDHWVKEGLGVRHYFRYCDDMVVFGSDKSELHRLRVLIDRFMRNRLRLEMKTNWQVFPVDVRGVDFLGYRFFRAYTLVRKSIVKRFINSVRAEKTASVPAYNGWFSWADTYNLVRKYGCRCGV